MPAHPVVPGPRTTTSQAEARRLETQARRLRFATDELSRLAEARSFGDETPAALLRAVAEFSRELEEVERRQADLARPRSDRRRPWPAPPESIASR